MREVLKGESGLANRRTCIGHASLHVWSETALAVAS